VCVLPMCDTIANRGRWPSKINEYLAAGRAVAITDVGDVATWVRNRGCGVVADAAPMPFAGAIVDLLGSPDARGAAEANAAALARGPLAWSNIAEDVADHYEHVLGNRTVLSA
jgi:hypothetical protein